MDLLNRTAHQTREDVVGLVAERFERRLSEESGALRLDIAAVRGEIASTKAELIRWMFIFWVGQVGATLGILFAFFRS